MANLWQHRPDGEDWKPVEVMDEARIGGGRIYRYADGLTSRERWVVLAGRRSGVRVNGAEVTAGVRSLRDRDAIEAGGELYFFTTERLPEVEPLPSQSTPVVCGRCRTVMEPGSPAVCCPQCGVWHHATAVLPCWASLAKCSLCSGSTAGVDYAWTPRGL